MGKRTKFQTFETAQLVAEAYEEDDPLLQPLPSVHEILKKESSFMPVVQTFDEECVLLEKPSL